MTSKWRDKVYLVLCLSQPVDHDKVHIAAIQGSISRKMKHACKHMAFGRLSWPLIAIE